MRSRPIPVPGFVPGFFSGLVVDHLDGARLMREAARDAWLLSGRSRDPAAVAATRARYARYHASCIADARRARLSAALVPGLSHS